MHASSRSPTPARTPGVAGSPCGPATAGPGTAPPGRRGAVGAGGDGVAGFESRIPLPEDVAGACVLLIDGLGAELLDAHLADAPVLAGLRGRTLQVGFPSTTVAGLAALGTGCRSGEHGLVGYSFRLPDVGLVNPLRWRMHPWGDDLREAVPPEQVQPIPTTFERAASAGVAVSVISGAEFTGIRADAGGPAGRSLYRCAGNGRSGGPGA